jgi:hypothetical protein
MIMLDCVRAWSLLACVVGIVTAAYPIAVDIEAGSHGCQTSCQCHTIEDLARHQPRHYPPQPRYYAHYSYTEKGGSGKGGSGKGGPGKGGSGKGDSGKGGMTKGGMSKGGMGKGGSGKGSSAKGGSGKGGSGKGGSPKGGSSKGGMGKGGMGKGMGKGGRGKGGMARRRELVTYHSEPKVRCTCACTCAEDPLFYYDGDDYSGHDQYDDSTQVGDDYIVEDGGYCCGYEEICEHDGGYGGSEPESGYYYQNDDDGAWPGEPTCRRVCVVPCGNPVPIPAPRPMPVLQPIRDDPVIRPVPVPQPIPDDPVFRPVPVPQPIPDDPVFRPVPVPQPIPDDPVFRPVLRQR